MKILKKKNIDQILLEIKRQNNTNIKSIFINAHLIFNNSPFRRDCGGLEILKHLRLTEEIFPACCTFAKGRLI